MARLQKITQAAGTTGSAEHPAFPARWAYGLYVLSPGTGLIAPVNAALVKRSQGWPQPREGRNIRLRRPRPSVVAQKRLMSHGHRIPTPRIVTIARTSLCIEAG